MGPEGQLDRGEFLLEKPGKLRFEFEAPNPTLIVATGGKIYVKNSRLNTVESYNVLDVPLDLLLNDNVNLKANRAITGIDIQNDALVVHARTSSNRQQGNIQLVFSYPEIELRQWSVKDNQGGTTMVALHNPETGVNLDEDLFSRPVKIPAVRRRRDTGLAGLRCGIARRHSLPPRRRRICSCRARGAWARCRC